jgi:hypothetical protein
MARFDPREHELDRVDGWHRGRWVEFILTRQRMVWTITVLVDGDLFGSFDEDTNTGDLVGILLSEERMVGTFESLIERFLGKEAA